MIEKFLNIHIVQMCTEKKKQKNHTWFHGISCTIVRVKFFDFYTVWPTYCTIHRSENLMEHTPPALIAWVLASLIVTQCGKSRNLLSLDENYVKSMYDLKSKDS